MNTKLSIITVCFNDLTNLKDTVESLQTQNYQKFQHIVIDGKSNDGTIEYLQQLRTNYELKFISEKDNGIYDAMNKGVKLSTGQFLWFLNAGDIINAPDIIYKLIKSLKPDIGLLFAPVKYISDQFSVDSHIENNLKPENFIMKMPVCHQGMIFNKKRLPKPAYNTKYIIAADYDLVLYLLFEKKIKYIQKNYIIANYRLDGYSAKHWFKGTIEYLIINIRSRYCPTIKIILLFIRNISKNTGIRVLQHLKLYKHYKFFKDKIKKSI